MSITMTPQQRKAKRKVIEALQGNGLGLSFGELMQTTGLSKTSLTKTLSVIDAVEENGLYILSFDKAIEKSPSVANPTVDDGGNEIPINEPTLINPNTGREYIELPETGSTIKQQILEQIAQSEDTQADDFELQPPPISQKHFLLIEHCYLSLAQDGTGQEPAIAEIGWFDEEGEALEEDDCNVLDRAVEKFSNTVDFLGVTYNRLFVASSQLFHGIFDDIQIAHARMAELMAKKPSNHFEVIEV